MVFIYYLFDGNDCWNSLENAVDVMINTMKYTWGQMSLPVCYPCPYQTKNKNASHGAQYYLQRILCKVKKTPQISKNIRSVWA